MYGLGGRGGILDEPERRHTTTTKKKPRGRRSTKKRNRGPEPPRQAYHYFSAENRQKLKETNPEVFEAGIDIMLKEMWDDLPLEEKQRFYVLASEDKKRYKKDKQKHDKKMRNARPKPKKAKNGYLMFLDSNLDVMRKQHHNKTYQEVLKMACNHWKHLNSEEKEPYYNLAAADKERYEKEKAAMRNKPKRPRSGFIMFLQSNLDVIRKRNPDKTYQENLKLACFHWKQLSIEEKKPYFQLAAVDKERYEREKAVMEQKKKPKAKRPRSAFIFFSQSARHKIMEAHPGLKLVDVSKILGAQWKHMSNTEKEPYAILAAEDRMRFQSEKAANAKAAS